MRSRVLKGFQRGNFEQWLIGQYVVCGLKLRLMESSQLCCDGLWTRKVKIVSRVSLDEARLTSPHPSLLPETENHA